MLCLVVRIGLLQCAVSLRGLAILPLLLFEDPGVFGVEAFSFLMLKADVGACGFPESFSSSPKESFMMSRTVSSREITASEAGFLFSFFAPLCPNTLPDLTKAMDKLDLKDVNM